ncbi:MAG: hypothetical protein MZV70_76155 [Desulfobacterales bacterium]|nr:hypothetical protein [Desulfobacterales bacterium]
MLQVIQVYVDAKKFDDSLYLLNGMLKGAPDSPDLHHLKGFSLFGLKKNARGPARVPTGHARIALLPGRDGPHRLHSAGAGQNRGGHRAASDAVIQKQPRKRRAQAIYLASVYEEAGDFGEAERLLLQAHRKRPGQSALSTSVWGSFMTSRRTRTPPSRPCAR